MSWSHGPGDKTRRATNECVLCDVGDNNIAFAALRTRGVVDYVTDVCVSILSAITWKERERKLHLSTARLSPVIAL
jgi:hypothetical protein